MGWIIFLALAIPLVGVIAWVALDESFVRVEPGQLGLLLVHGRATDRVLEPGPHWVPALRRRMVQTYPSLELSFTAGAGAEDSVPEATIERVAPALQVTLGDRHTVAVSYTLRVRLDREKLVEVHERFGPDGIWAAIRDESARCVRARLADGEVRIEDLVGPERQRVEGQLAEDITQALTDDGMLVTSFFLGDLGLGRAGEVIAATARARLELEREQAEAEMRMVRARIDADLAPYLASTDAALRYREVDSWRELAHAQTPGLVVPSPGQPRASTTSEGTAAPEPAATPPEAQ